MENYDDSSIFFLSKKIQISLITCTHSPFLTDTHIEDNYYYISMIGWVKEAAREIG